MGTYSGYTDIIGESVNACVAAVVSTYIRTSTAHSLLTTRSVPGSCILCCMANRIAKSAIGFDVCGYNDQPVLSDFFVVILQVSRQLFVIFYIRRNCAST